MPALFEQVISINEANRTYLVRYDGLGAARDEWRREGELQSVEAAGTRRRRTGLGN